MRIVSGIVAILLMMSVSAHSIQPGKAADNYWQVSLTPKFAHSDRRDEFWRTKKVGDKIEIYPACDPKGKAFATAVALPEGGFKLDGAFGNLSAKIDKKDRLILEMGAESFGQGKRIAPVTCEDGIPKKITTIHPQVEGSFAALTGGAAELQASLSATLSTVRDPPLAPLPEPKDSVSYLENGDAYACHTLPITLASVRPLENVPTLGAVSDIWPGAILQGKNYSKGILQPVSIPRSEGTTMIITGVNLEPGSKYSTKVNGPASRETVNDALQRLLSQRVKSTEANSISFRTDIITSSDHLAYALGVDGRFLNGLDKTLPIEQNSGRSYVLASFSQTFYVASVEDPEDPYSFFKDGANFTDKRNQIGADNPPLYVKSVSYGRMIYFLVSSEHASDAVLTALTSAHEGKSDGKVTSKGKEYTFNEIFKGSTISFVVQGGDALPALGQMGKITNVENSYEAFKNIITDKNLGTVTDFTKGVPVAYTLGYLTTLATAAMGYKTAFNRTECIQTPKKYASFFIWLNCIDDIATVTLINERTKSSTLLYSGAGAPKFINVDAAIGDNEATDHNFQLVFALYNNGGPSCLHFNLFRRRFGETNDFAGWNPWTYTFSPISVDLKGSPNWAAFPWKTLGGSWNVGQIVGWVIRINRFTGEGTYITGE